MSDLRDRLRTVRGAIPARRVPLFVALAVFVLVGIVVMRLLPARQAPAAMQAASPEAITPAVTLALPAAPTQPPTPLTGQIALDDFRIVIPRGWQRRPDLEEQGPGTKLFLMGPTVGQGQLYIGIDVYTLPHGMKLPDFIKRYSAQWTGLGVLTDKPATLCGKPARMLSMSDGSVDKLFLVTVRGSHGYVVGMFGPTGQGPENVKAFQVVVDSFQFYG